MNIKRITPLHNYVLVKPTEAPSTTESGLFLPENNKQLPETGEVLNYGNGTYQNGMWVDTLPFDLEDKVLFMKYAGIETKLNGEKVLLLKDTDILAIINDEVLDK